MTAAYPAALPSFGDPVGANLPNLIGGRTHAQSHRDLGDEIEAITAELGVLPKGSFGSVLERLDDLDVRPVPLGNLPTASGNAIVGPEDYIGFDAAVAASGQAFFPFQSALGGSVSPGTDPGGRPGIAELHIGTTAGTGWALSRTALSILLGNGEATWEACLGVDALGLVTRDYDLVAGFFTGTAALPNDGMYFRYNYNQNSGKLIATTVVGGVATTQNLTYTVAAGTWVRLAIRVNAPKTSVEFLVDGVVLATLTTNLTAALVGAGVAMQKLGGGGVLDAKALVDYQFASIAITNPR